MTDPDAGEALRSRVEEAIYAGAEAVDPDEHEEEVALRERLADILIRTANAIKGEPEPLTSHSWHDLPEAHARAVAEAKREALLEAAKVPNPGPAILCHSPRDRDDQWRQMLQARARAADPEAGR